MTQSAPTSRRVALVPPQHGAWAFLALPLACGAAVSPRSPLLLALAVTWVLAYPVSYFVLALVKDSTSRHPHPGRYRTPLLVWTLAALPTTVFLLVARPWLAWVALLYLATFCVNVLYARRRDDRALLNDSVFIAQCTAMVVVTWAICAGQRSWSPPPLSSAPSHLWVLTVAVGLMLVGSTLHVKSLIRERANVTFGRRARAFALASVAASVVLAWWWGLPQGVFLVVPFGFLAARSVVMTGRPPKPSRIGMIELLGFLLLALPALALGRH